jgi:hypothetical protein
MYLLKKKTRERLSFFTDAKTKAQAYMVSDRDNIKSKPVWLHSEQQQ